MVQVEDQLGEENLIASLVDLWSEQLGQLN